MARMRVRTGDLLDGFLVGEKLHQGGMAEIFAVTKEGIDTPLVMKVPLILDGDDPTMIVSFEQEMTILPRLTGPHVPRCFGIGDFATQPYLVIERISGDSLLSRFQQAPLALDEVVDLGARIALALASLHQQEVIHLDLKPSNIMLRPSGEAVFIDFGLSRHLRLPDLLAEEFRIPMGTAPYIAPEQVMKLREEPRSDIFALGVLLYALATGERPFGNPKHKTKALIRRLHEAPRPPRFLRKDMPGFLQEIILRCLEVKPEQRYPTARQLAFDLRHPEHVTLTERSTRKPVSRLRNFLAGRFWNASAAPLSTTASYRHATTAPIVMVAVDLSSEGAPLTGPIQSLATTLLDARPMARLACVNVLKTARIGLDTLTENDGSSIHVNRLVELKNWAADLRLPAHRLTFHVLEGADPADVLLTFARNNHVDHLVVGARGSGGVRRYLGSVSTAIVAEATCSVTVVRAPDTREEPAVAN
ncbi:MAG: bifunctional serine/threonine-protein kinase/universal stress protein [Beijerinckiaceae bacterium]|jgi:serine/threonine protein kinase|nr:bifunctional serine/threonine-protein kinase/universal stress protein [Beijerinckiaceae bacterium]